MFCDEPSQFRPPFEVDNVVLPFLLWQASCRGFTRQGNCDAQTSQEETNLLATWVLKEMMSLEIEGTVHLWRQ